LTSFTVRRTFIFMFFSSVALTVLHSFPTRRSSDLHHGGKDHDAGVRLEGDRRQPIDRHHAQSLEHRGDDRRLERRRGSRGRRAGDRKSTRLNSSHVAISYAVFCLKKKKL